MRKKLSKFLTALMVMSVVLSTLQFTAFASATDAKTTVTPAAEATDAAATSAVEPTGAAFTPTADGVEVALYLMESNESWSYGDVPAKDWSEPKSNSVIIKEDGTYTLTLTDLDIPSEYFMLCYLKDVAAYPKDTTVKHSNVPDDLMVITDEFKFNGETKELNDKVRTGLKAGIFDVAYHNNWDENDNCVNLNPTINSVEVTFTVTGITGEPGAIKYAPTQAATPTAAAVAASDTESKPVVSDTTEDNNSGNNLALIIGIAAAIIIAVVLIFVVKKKK